MFFMFRVSLSLPVLNLILVSLALAQFPPTSPVRNAPTSAPLASAQGFHQSSDEEIVRAGAQK